MVPGAHTCAALVEADAHRGPALSGGRHACASVVPVVAGKGSARGRQADGYGSIRVISPISEAT